MRFFMPLPSLPHMGSIVPTRLSRIHADEPSSSSYRNGPFDDPCRKPACRRFLLQQDTFGAGWRDANRQRRISAPSDNGQAGDLPQAAARKIDQRLGREAAGGVFLSEKIRRTTKIQIRSRAGVQPQPTPASNRWLAEQLHMGRPEAVSVYVRRRRLSGGVDRPDYQRLITIVSTLSVSRD